MPLLEEDGDGLRLLFDPNFTNPNPEQDGISGVGFIVLLVLWDEFLPSEMMLLLLVLLLGVLLIVLLLLILTVVVLLLLVELVGSVAPNSPVTASTPSESPKGLFLLFLLSSGRLWSEAAYLETVERCMHSGWFWPNIVAFSGLGLEFGLVFSATFPGYKTEKERAGSSLSSMCLHVS